MQGVIEPRIRRRVELFHDFADREIKAIGSPRDARMVFAPHNPRKPFRLEWTEGNPKTGFRRRVVEFGPNLTKVGDKTLSRSEERVVKEQLASEGGGLAKNPSIRMLMTIHGRGMHDDIMRVAEVASGHKVMELGPGPGVLTERLVQQAGHVTAVDFSPEVVEELNLRKRLMGWDKLKVLESDFDELPETHKEGYGRFDRVISAFSTESHPHPIRLFKMLRALLKPGGTLTIAEMTPFHASLRGLLEKAGFEVNHWEVHPHPVQVLGEAYYTIVRAKKKLKDATT